MNHGLNPKSGIRNAKYPPRRAGIQTAKKGYWNFMRGTVLALMLAGLAAVSEAEVVEQIVAKVNDEVITRSEVEQVLEPILKQYKSAYTAEELKTRTAEARRNVIDRLIEEKLIIQAAEEKEIEVNISEVEKMIKQTMLKFPTEEKFFEVLKAEGLNLEILQERYRKELTYKKIVNMEVRARVVVAPKEVEEYYAAHIEELKSPEMLRLSQIFLKTEEGKDEEVKKRIEDILKRLKQGEDFGKLAKEYSQDPYAEKGGDMGFVQKGKLLEELDKILPSLDIGQISGIIKSSLGYHILKLQARKEEQLKKIADVREVIETVIFQEKMSKRFSEWIAGLKKDAYVWIRE